MDEVIGAIGYRPSTWTRFGLAAVTAGGCGLFLIVPHVLVAAAHVPPIVVQLIIAAVWCYWLGWLFPARWRAQLRAYGRKEAYRVAFPVDIVPGVCANFAQILRPACYGLLGSSWAVSTTPIAVSGVLFVILGAVMIALALRVIGIAGAMFVSEYTLSHPRLTVEGIYGVMRHPLFVGGVILSVGLAALTGSVEALLMAATNLAVVPLFVVAENRRSRLVLGDTFLRYRSVVPAVPWISLRASMTGVHRRRSNPPRDTGI